MICVLGDFEAEAAEMRAMMAIEEAEEEVAENEDDGVEASLATEASEATLAKAATDIPPSSHALL